MKYGHILHFVATSQWAIQREKLDEILSVLSMRVIGEQFSAEEIRARIGDPQPPTPSKRGAVAVIPLRGVIAHRMSALEESSGGMSADRFTAMVRQAAADESVGTIVLDVDSPGGTVVGVPEASKAVFEARKSKRIVAVANSKMASAAYWIASAAHEIVGHPSAFEASIGSIGVFMAHRDLSEALAKAGEKITLISAGKHKVEGLPIQPLTDEHRAHLQGMVDAAYATFVKDVARNRGVGVADVRDGFGEGRALGSKDAKASGMIDSIGTLEDVIGSLVSAKGRSSMRAEGDEPALEELPPAAAAAAVSEGFRQRLERY